MRYHVPFSNLEHYRMPRIVTPPAEDILAAIRRGQTYSELAAIYGCSESTLRRRVTDSGLVTRPQHGRLPATSLVERQAPEWMDQGLCAQTDPALFFPETGTSPRLARKVCAGCEVLEQCLAYALDNDERFGVWAGTTPAQRRKLRRERKEATS
jgi:transposase-like protein